MTALKEKDVSYPKPSTIDEAGKVFFYQSRVLRAVYSNDFANLYQSLFREDWFEKVFEAGLVRSWICEDLQMEGVPLILEHSRISFQTLPAEWTSKMHWLAAKMMIRVNLALSQFDYLLKDSHPFNIMFDKGYPKFVDFGSMIYAKEINPHWLHQFMLFFGMPIWLASRRCGGLAREYRRQHLVGFGLRLSEKPLVKYVLLGSLKRLLFYRRTPHKFFKKLDQWLDQHRPVESKKEKWANYPQSHMAENVLSPRTVKQEFVFNVLARERPEKVLDCAANKGFYSEMAAALGASVISFDYEEFCVDRCLTLAQINSMDITPAIMDFTLPTPSYGRGLMGKDAFQRFQVDISLALGLVHHICIGQGLPVKLFCDICMNYAKKGIVFQYVDPQDKHVRLWNKPIPKDYSIGEICKYFAARFPLIERSETLTHNGLCRTWFYFHN